MKQSWLFVAGAASIGPGVVATSAQAPTPTVTSPAQVAVSQPLRDGFDDSRPTDRLTHPHLPLPPHGRGRGSGGDQDDALQNTFGPLISSSTDNCASFPGVGASGYAPPDTDIAVG